jgi:hypothetical protein
MKFHRPSEGFTGRPVNPEADVTGGQMTPRERVTRS